MAKNMNVASRRTVRCSRLLIKQGDMGGEGGRIGNRTADKVLTQEEWDQGIRFNEQGVKYLEEKEDDTLEDTLRSIHDRLVARRQDRASLGERTINITTGEGITAEVIAAARRFGAGGAVPLIEDHSGDIL